MAFFTEVNPDFKVSPRFPYSTSGKKNLHLKHPTCTVLGYARDFGSKMHESLKRTTNWAAFYFTHSESLPSSSREQNCFERHFKYESVTIKTMSKSDLRTIREWAQENGKAVRQLTIRQTNTKYAAGTLPLNMYRKKLPV